LPQKNFLGINLKTLLFDKKIKINKIYVTDALMDVEVNEKEKPITIYMIQKANNPQVQKLILPPFFEIGKR